MLFGWKVILISLDITVHVCCTQWQIKPGPNSIMINEQNAILYYCTESLFNLENGRTWRHSGSLLHCTLNKHSWALFKALALLKSPDPIVLIVPYISLILTRLVGRRVFTVFLYFAVNNEPYDEVIPVS